MTTLPISLKVDYKEYNSMALIKIHGEPQVFQRPSSTGKLFQDISMMLFQQLVMSRASAALGSQALKPFTNPVSVEITCTTHRLFKEFELEYVTKSILDGLNLSIIQDDSLVTMALCELKKGTKRSPKERIDITVREVGSNNAISFKLDTPVIQKKVAVSYSVGGVLQYNPQFLLDLTMIDNAISTNRGSSNKWYDICHMYFDTEYMNKDVDNMFLMYIGSLRRNGLLNSSNNIVIGMYKRHVDGEGGRTLINLISK